MIPKVFSTKLKALMALFNAKTCVTFLYCTS